MKITEKALRDNGWKSVFLYTFCSAYLKAVNMKTDLEIVFYVSDDPTVRLRMGTSRIELPNVTTLEALAQLEYLLSPYTVVDTSSIDAAIRARFAEGGEE